METTPIYISGRSYKKLNHKSGLTIYLCPMPGYNSAYAIFGTPYGSVDVTFKTGSDESFITVPAGVAHFLEHKLFENEDCDAFERYAKTGASANAFTSFDRTCYLFECAINFRESLHILLDFVTSPYFTKQTVEKEQGIIGQEIRMYEDNPDWRVMFNLLCALYSENPVKTDIAGTVESISKIDDKLLYRCYNTFYNLNNMVLAVAGNFDIDEVLAEADEVLKKAEPVEIEYQRASEPRGVARAKVLQSLAVSAPMFSIGFKAVPRDYSGNMRDSILDEMLLEIIAGEFSPLYRRLYDKSLINQTFYGECMVGRDYMCNMISGESRDPIQVYDEVKAEVERITQSGIDSELFEAAKAAVYGRYLTALDTPEGVVGMMVTEEFSKVPVQEIIELASGVTIVGLKERLTNSFDPKHSAISVINPVS